MTEPRPRALDVERRCRGQLCRARLLADVGWDVVKSEPVGGDPFRIARSRWGGGAGGAFAFANSGKRSAIVAFHDLVRIAAVADVVIGDFSPAGLAAAQLPPDAFDRSRLARQLHSVSAFGLTGPKTTWASTELMMAQAASQMMFLTGEYDQSPMQLPPYQGEVIAGVAAATATCWPSAVRAPMDVAPP